MNESETIDTKDPSNAKLQAQPREWVTPTFEQVGLKDALTGAGGPFVNDAQTDSS